MQNKNSINIIQKAAEDAIKSQQDDSHYNTSSVASALGIVAANAVDMIISDIQQLITSGQRTKLDGYILCLSKIASHRLGWHCVTTAYQSHQESVPSQYYALFGKDKKQEPIYRNSRFKIGI